MNPSAQWRVRVKQCSWFGPSRPLNPIKGKTRSVGKVGVLTVALSGASLVPALAQERTKPFPSFEVTAQDTTSPTFVFSDAYATVDSPVVISIPGRKLTSADREFRTDLQRHWLSLNVPKTLELRGRTLSECNRVVAGEHPFCDRYVFVDPQSGKETAFYIYVGNWP